MLFKWITKTVRKLFGSNNVEEEKFKKILELKEQFGKGEISPEVFRDAFYEWMGFPRKEDKDEGNLPPRPGEDPFKTIKVIEEGLQPSDRDAIRCIMRVRGTDLYFSLRHVRHEGGWWYDLDGARLTTAQGEEIPGRKGELPDDLCAKIKARFGHTDLKNAPAPTFG